MAIDVNVLGKVKMAYGVEVDINYDCPHCGENVTESICFSNSISNCVAVVYDQACPECGEDNDLDVDLY